ncbi:MULTISPECIES: histidine kinase [unclassified Luteimonas]|uniref:sensor histidine kinase n=1 Tax=unclassified Luteimonas TaxID=2629088 RepID=UPI0018F106BA|nr:MULTISPECIES: histidine kinase [unclassified Luteimonas]MBJ6978783.1 histidine kinase [Luteimonas sp. MC1895]MBJ6983683.1 histidine kinase [Luteimonas sp. MC1750]QQO06522.1 histidine kinase [Luteimonas sp. MC1750]
MRLAIHSPLETLAQPRTVVATLIAGEGLALVLALASNAGEDRWLYFGLASLLIQWVALLTLALMYALRSALGRLHAVYLAWTALGLLVANAWLVGTLTWVTLRDAWPMEETWAGFFVRLTGIALILGLMALATFRITWSSRQLALRTKQAELESLQARTHPHFLFNTLNTAAALVHARPDAAETLLLDLSDLFRAALTGPSYIPLEQEVDLTKRYLSIEHLRLGKRLDVRWELPVPLPAVSLPSLSLQPLVENAVRHGIERREGGGSIDILVTSDAQHLILSVRNDLPAGVTPDDGRGHGVGLASVSQRIDDMTGGEGGVDTHTSAGRHVATIRIPWASALRRAL